MTPALGPILTHVPDLAALRGALALMRADLLKVVSRWGLPGGWHPAAAAEAAHLCPTLIVRTVAGDPSYAGGRAPHPFASAVLDEVAPWGRARPDLVVELGNEPLNGPHPLDPFEYAYHLGRAVDALRAALPGARILGPAFSLNPAFTGDLDRWLRVLAPALRRCDALALHAYTAQELAHGRALAAQHAPGLPVWLTEVNLAGELPDAERARRLWALIAASGADAACVYHLDRSAEAPTAEQGPASYRLSDDTLAALSLRGDARPDAPALPLGAAVPGFAMDIRHWRTVAAFRAHLARYRHADTARWARGVVVHHTAKPAPAEWRGLASMQALARYYRGLGWPSGPHLFVASGSPDPAHDGIWQLSPLNAPGTHARAANPAMWGVEHVGDFTVRPMPPDTAALGAGATAALLDWAGLPTTAMTVTPHAQWGKPECPGAAVDMAAYRRAVAALRAGDG